ncbi:MAG: amino acid ABC transporter substrate-binding protein [Rhodobacterales bacterium 65-51]|jgi:polar amino acid transport system substrate-binding protein|uniref:ABC transporter substrate-binding protein n=1 Tax=uncultured Gemmobacter sp. TaxID=1095917 RepID=UPI00096299FD|nr:ABC transporter substrate-binding protein [uncultured Gemmobacter sp.]OJY28202.1 MAG: amino acid ABC transporter substrate-binding protein [Rhodobacterales bacterium 65-51]
MKMTRRTGIVAGLMLGLSLSTAAFAQDALRVGAYPANPPWENKTEAGTFEGFEVDIVNEIARRMGTTANIDGMDFKALFVASASGRVDMVISSLTITNERLESQSFTQPYFQGALGIGVKDGSDIVSVEGLKGKVVGSVATSFPENWLKEREAEIGYAEYKSYDTTSNMLTDLLNGRIDAAVNDVVGLRYAFTQMKGLTVGAEIVTGEKFAMMMPKGSDKLEQVNQILSDMKSDGTMAAIYEKWMGVAPAADSYTVTPMPMPTSAD